MWLHNLSPVVTGLDDLPKFGDAMPFRDVKTGATGTTSVAPKFSDALTVSPPGGGRMQNLATIAEVPRG